MSFFSKTIGRETVQQRIDALLKGSEIYKPDGEGPFPVVLQLHGCGGKKNLQGRWAAVAKRAGWAVVVVDSYTHRGISTLEAYATVCTGVQLWGGERAGDLYAMMQWLRGQPWADARRLVAAGWSHGGWTVLDAMSLSAGREAERVTRLAELPAEPLSGLVGAFVIYPYQGLGAIAPGRGLRVDIGVKALVGTHDLIVGSKSVARALNRMPTPGAPVDVVMMEGATHAFDEIEAQDMRVRYDPVLTAKAEGIYTEYLGAAAGRVSIL